MKLEYIRIYKAASVDDRKTKYTVYFVVDELVYDPIKAIADYLRAQGDTDISIEAVGTGNLIKE